MQGPPNTMGLLLRYKGVMKVVNMGITPGSDEKNFQHLLMLHGSRGRKR